MRRQAAVHLAWRFAVFRCSIRDLLWLTLVVATGFGWVVRERQLGEREQQLQAENVRLQTDCEKLRTELARLRPSSSIREFMMQPRPGNGIIGP
jgi:hypothetical protein